MCVQFSPAERDAFSAVKRAFDPPGLLNPDKAIPDAARAAPSTARCTCAAAVPHPTCRASEQDR